MKTETRVQASGAGLTEVLADAAAKIDAFYGHSRWQIVEVRARPLVETPGSPIPAIWEADVTAESSE